MKIVVIGASGRIGEKLVYNLRQEHCTIVQASPSFGVDAVTGAGLARALSGAGVVIDMSDSPSPDGEAALRFFGTSGVNLMAAGRAAHIRHYIALSIVGLDRLLSGGYFRAKKVQEDLIKASALPARESPSRRSRDGGARGLRRSAAGRFGHPCPQLRRGARRSLAPS